MTVKKKYAALFILLILSLGFLFVSLGKYRFYQNYINVKYYTKNSQNTLVKENPFADDKEENKNIQKINLNSADIRTLTMLPGIGRETALKIVEYRSQNGRYKSIEDLIYIKGIGVKKLEKIKKYVTIK